MKKTPANISINLAPKDPFYETLLGRTLRWALSAGRYIIIFTELVVIVSFAARFTLDRQLTDLNQSISQKQNVIKSFGQFENNFRTTQAKIDDYKNLSQDANITEIFKSLTEVTPLDIVVHDLNISQTTVSISGEALSQDSFNLFVNNLQLSPKLLNITVTKIEENDNDRPGFKFSIKANTKETVTIKNKTPKQTNSTEE